MRKATFTFLLLGGALILTPTAVRSVDMDPHPNGTPGVVVPPKSVNPPAENGAVIDQHKPRCDTGGVPDAESEEKTVPKQRCE